MGIGTLILKPGASGASENHLNLLGEKGRAGMEPRGSRRGRQANYCIFFVRLPKNFGH